MTAMPVVEPEAEFISALPPWLRSCWRETDDLTGWLQLAAASGWSIPTLAAECSHGLRGTFNAAAVVKSRLHRFAQQQPPRTHTAVFVQPKPHCGHPGCDPQTRWFTDLTTGQLIDRCPECWTAAE